MRRNLDEIFSNLLDVYSKTGKIGYTKPVNLAHARKIAYCAALNILKKENEKEIQKQLSTTSSQPCQPTGGVTGSQTCCQLKLF